MIAFADVTHTHFFSSFFFLQLYLYLLQRMLVVRHALLLRYKGVEFLQSPVPDSVLSDPISYSKPAWKRQFCLPGDVFFAVNSLGQLHLLVFKHMFEFHYISTHQCPVADAKFPVPLTLVHVFPSSIFFCSCYHFIL